MRGNLSGCQGGTRIAHGFSSACWEGGGRSAPSVFGGWRSAMRPRSGRAAGGAAVNRQSCAGCGCLGLAAGSSALWAAVVVFALLAARPQWQASQFAVRTRTPFNPAGHRERAERARMPAERPRETRQQAVPSAGRPALFPGRERRGTRSPIRSVGTPTAKAGVGSPGASVRRSSLLLTGRAPPGRSRAATTLRRVAAGASNARTNRASVLDGE